MNILPNGSWDCETTEPHSFDESLCREIIHLFDGNEISSVCDMGCGAGQYVAELNEGGFVAVGIDGNPNTWKFNADCHQQDLSKPVAVGKFDAVLSLETGEHIPREFEHTFLSNITLAAQRIVVLSWFPIPGHGIGHVNERSNEWVVTQMFERGFVHQPEWSQILRDSATKWWFKHSILAFKKA